MCVCVRERVCVCVYIHIYTYTLHNIHTYITHIYIYNTHIHAHICTHIYIYNLHIRIKHTHTYTHTHIHIWASMVTQMVKNLPAVQETWVRSLNQEDILEPSMATHSSIAGKIPWTEKPGGLQFRGSQRVRHD